VFTRIFLAIKNFPEWLNDVKKHDTLLFYGIWLLIAMVLLSIMHFFSFRNDTVYLILMVAIPLIEVLLQTRRTILSRTKDALFSHYQIQAENFPVLFMILMMIINFPMIIYSHNGFGSEIYDEYFVAMIFTIILILLFILLTKLKGKVRIGVLSLSYLLGLLFLGITYVLAITI